jgi:hypothetical protein
LGPHSSGAGGQPHEIDSREADWNYLAESWCSPGDDWHFGCVGEVATRAAALDVAADGLYVGFAAPFQTPSERRNLPAPAAPLRLGISSSQSLLGSFLPISFSDFLLKTQN